MQVTYDATGRKWEKQSGNNTTEYISDIEYRNGAIEAIYAPDGRLVFDGLNGGSAEFSAEYFHQDHLGNNRLVFCDFNNNGIIETSDDPGTPTNELEVTQEIHYYPFGMEQNGNWYATVAPDNVKLYNGKELNREGNINLYDYGARWYDPALGRWTTIDPLAENYYPYSPYNYVLNNPIRNIDPDGRSVDNTIYIDNNGKELARTEDNLPDAIVVVQDENISNFNQDYMSASLSPDHISDEDVATLRSHGDSYMVDGMNDVWDASMAVTLSPGSGGYVDASGNPVTDLHPEAGSYFNVSEDGKTLTVDSDIYTSESTDAVGLGGDRPSIHNHPVHGGLYKKTPGGVSGPLNEPESPSSQDGRNSYGRQKRNPSRYRDVVVGPDNIYLYKGYTKAGKVPRSFFKKN
ncbi:MAG: hypothetical protein MI974_13395 [Chitinophagales bacterium]|nr:hypothetical protein [Chitinophagales bacterium]